MSTFKTYTTLNLNETQFKDINELWNNEYPIKLKDRFPLLLQDAICKNHYLIEDENKSVIAWAVVFEKDNQIRFSIIVSSKQKGKGLGTDLINLIKTDHPSFYGWVIDHNNDLKLNNEPYLSPLDFYMKQGFQIIPESRIDSEMIKAVLIKWEANNG